MNFVRVWALIERDLRKFFRSPALMMTSMIFPLMQLIVLGYAFGGKVTGVQVAFVDMDNSVESQKIREMFNGIAAGPRTFHVIDYNSPEKADEDLRNGYVRAVIYVPQNFSQRFYHRDRPRIAFMEDNTDQFISSGAREPDTVRHRGNLSVHRLHQISAGGFDCAFYLCGGYDRRRNYLH